MPNFQYKGRTGRGEAVTGQLEAENADAVASQLMNTGITPVEIDPAPEGGSDEPGALRRMLRRNPGLDDLILFTRQMYSLTKSGVPIARGLRGLAESTHNEVLREIIAEVVENLESGRDLAGSLARHAEIFGPMYINIVRVGENSGTLEQSFQRLAQYLQLDRDTRKRVKSALFYPMVVIAAIIVAIGIVTVWVIPAFSGMFERFDADLPWATRAIMGASNFAQAYWVWVLAGMVGAVIGFRYWSKSESGRPIWDRWKLRIPAVGSIVHRATLARFARGLATSFRAGVPIVQALTLVARSLDNEFIAQRLNGMRDGVERGESLYRSAAATGILTPLVLQMIQVGEETGAVDDMLDEVADFYEQEVDYALQNLSATIEPILIIFVGVLVLILALGVFLPLWSLGAVAL